MDAASFLSGFWDGENNEYVLEGFLKVEGGVMYGVWRDETFDPKSMVEILRDMPKDRLSERPYQPGQACDGSIGAPVMALFYDWCRKAGRDPSGLVKQAYEGEDRLTQESIAINERDAKWQGVAIPDVWGDQETGLLVQSLHNIKWHDLAGVVSDIHAGEEVPAKKTYNIVHEGKAYELAFVLNEDSGIITAYCDGGGGPAVFSNCISLDLPFPPVEGCVWLKTYSENDILSEDMINDGLFERTGHNQATGRTTVPEVRITEKLRGMLCTLEELKSVLCPPSEAASIKL
jgi:hypothetical protein